MKRVYCRCNGGDYYTGSHCPFDGWSSQATIDIAAAVERLLSTGREPSVDELRAVGLSDEALQRVLVVEFPSPLTAFDALMPDRFIIGGEEKLLKDLPAAFM